MRPFTDHQIELAHELKLLGLPWEPAIGHFVYDPGQNVNAPSPFQPGVYFILNYDYFTNKLGGLERFRELLTWLPTWDDARLILRQLRVDDATIAACIRDSGAIESDRELDVLLELIAQKFRPVK